MDEIFFGEKCVENLRSITNQKINIFSNQNPDSKWSESRECCVCRPKNSMWITWTEKKIVHIHAACVLYGGVSRSLSRVMCVCALFCCYFVWKMIKRCVSPAKVFGDVKCMSRIVRLLSDVVSRIHVYRVVFVFSVDVCVCLCVCMLVDVCSVSTVRCCACETNIVRSISAPILPMCVSVWFLCLSFSLCFFCFSVSVAAAAVAVALLIAASVGRSAVWSFVCIFFSLSVFLLLHRRSLSQSNRSHLWWFAFVHVSVCVCAFCSALLCSQLMCAMCVFGSLAIMLTFIAIIVIIIYLALCIVFVPKI